MTRGAIAGLADGTLTTAVALLYAAQVRRSNTEGDYRFSLSLEGQGVVGTLYNELQSGKVPASPGVDALAKVSFAMDFPDSLGKKLLGGLRRKAPGDGHELDLGVLPLERAPDGSVAPSKHLWGAAVDMSLLLLVADASGGRAPDRAVDGGFERLLASFPKGVPDCVLMWFLDAPSTPEVRPPPQGPGRSQLASDTLAKNLPRTASALAAAKQEPPCAFVWLERDLSGGRGAIKRRRLFEAGGIEPVYPYDEMTTLMDALAARSR